MGKSNEELSHSITKRIIADTFKLLLKLMSQLI